MGTLCVHLRGAPPVQQLLPAHLLELQGAAVLQRGAERARGLRGAARVQPRRQGGLDTRRQGGLDTRHDVITPEANVGEHGHRAWCGCMMSSSERGKGRARCFVYELGFPR